MCLPGLFRHIEALFFQFIKIDNEHTKIVSSMIGWGSVTDWDKTYSFFAKGNE